jgi:sarcosine oxidase
MAEHTDVGVVGAGIVGLATAVALRDRGVSVTLYERGMPGHAQSGGDTRIFRHAHDDPRLVTWAARSRETWTAWEQRFATEFISADGVVALGPAALRRMAFAGAGVDLRVIAGDDVAARLPVMTDRPVDPVVLDVAGGAIRTVAVTRALVAALEGCLVSDEVYALRTTSTGSAEVRTGGVIAEHASVVVCAGVGTASLARGAGLDLPVTVEAALRSTFEVMGPPPDRLACLQDSSGAFGEASAYATALPGNARYAVGIGETIPLLADGPSVDPDALAALEQRIRTYVGKALPGLAPEPVGHRHCWITRLPWAEDGVAAWEADQVLFVAGHNLYKHAPALGEALADWAITGGLAEELRPEALLGAR